MSKIKFCAVIVLATALASAAYAKGGGGGGHGGGGGGRGGGGGHFGGGAHFGGGGHFGGARIGGAHFGGARIGGAHFGGARIGGRPSISRSAARPSFRSHRSFAVRGAPSRTASRAAARASRAAALNANRGATTLGRNRNASFGPNQSANVQNRTANLRSTAVQKALNSRAMTGALQNKRALVNPNTRAQLVATAATAGWLGGRSGRNAWWRHRHGGFGWVGPLFWPLAYYDIYDYALWGYGYDPLFWDYGYDDIYAGVFYPYGYDDLAAYMPSGGSGYRSTLGQASVQGSDARAAMPEQLAQLCGNDSRDIAGLPIDQVQQTLQLNDAQRAALDDLANASVKAAQDIKAACPTTIPVTATDRLAVMQQRIEAMIAAVQTVQPALQKFYDFLNDEQRAQLNALVQDQRLRKAARNTNGSLSQSCGTAQSGVTGWPTAEIEARLRLNDVQRASLEALQQANAKAADLIKNSCPTTEPITPPARLEAVANRLNAMLEAVKTVRTALDDFYSKLNDEQRAQFEAIGPALAGVSDRPADAQARVRRHRHHRASVGGLVRHFMSMARW